MYGNCTLSGMMVAEVLVLLGEQSGGGGGGKGAE